MKTFLVGVALAAVGPFLPTPWAAFTFLTGVFIASVILYIATAEWLTRKGYTT